ncbi:unnamed protein product, partial [Mesorhabditis belari]|uniref:Uncharacterized protein n=1 Tax=Mesorhabditis belari TaxID=2138241 RepID=A0AAF3FMK0_9BILA
MNFSKKGFLGPGNTSISYKTSPIYPAPFRGLDFKVSNLIQPRPPCKECFPETHSDGRAEYVNLLDLPNYGGMPYPLIASARQPWRFMADLRYTWNTPLQHQYPSVRHEVLNGQRVAESVANESNSSNVDQLSIRKKAATYYYEIRATLNRFVCKICGYLLFKV